jgi:hypothetical protein
MASMAIESGLASKEARKRRRDQRQSHRVSKTVRIRNTQLGTKSWWHPSKSERRRIRSQRRQTAETLRGEPMMIEAATVEPSLATSTERRFFDPAVDDLCDRLRKEVGDIEISLLTASPSAERKLRRQLRTVSRKLDRAKRRACAN